METSWITPGGRRRLRFAAVAALLAAILAGAAFRFYQPPESARALSHVPDGVECTLAMQNLLDGHGFTLRLNGADYPSRYQPWFSLVWVAPAIRFADGNVLWAWTGCFAAALAAVAAAFETGRRIGGAACGLLLAAVLGAFADFARFANVVMTEVPCTLLMICAAARWVRLCREEKIRIGGYLLFGLWCAAAGSLRSTALVLAGLALLPLVKHRPDRRTAAAALAAAWLPATAVAAANAIYNKIVFGEFLRSGYHFWDPYFYDTLTTTFHRRYLAANLCDYASQLNLLFLLLPALFLAAALPLLRRRDPAAAQNLMAYAVFAAAAAGVTAAVYLPYFSCHERFFLPVRVLLLLGAAAAAAILTRICCRRTAPVLLAAAACAITFAPWPDPYLLQRSHDRLRSSKIGLLCALREMLPEDAVLITIFPQGSAEYFFAGRGGRRIIPFFRCYEYAQMVTAPRRIAVPAEGLPPPPAEETLHYLEKHGGVRPYPLVFEENPEAVDRMIRAGRPVFVTDYTLRIHPPARVLLRRYRPQKVWEIDSVAVYRLMPRG